PIRQPARFYDGIIESAVSESAVRLSFGFQVGFKDLILMADFSFSPHGTDHYISFDAITFRRLYQFNCPIPVHRPFASSGDAPARSGRKDNSVDISACL